MIKQPINAAVDFCIAMISSIQKDDGESCVPGIVFRGLELNHATGKVLEYVEAMNVAPVGEERRFCRDTMIEKFPNESLELARIFAKALYEGSTFNPRALTNSFPSGNLAVTLADSGEEDFERLVKLNPGMREGYYTARQMAADGIITPEFIS